MTPWYRVCCRDCGAAESLPFEELVEAVRRIGHLKRSAEPSPELVLELLGEGPIPIVCSECGAVSTHLSSEGDDDWPSETKCQACSVTIPPERLEIFPDAKYCRDCQEESDQGTLSENQGYCSFCGGELAVGRTGGSGVSRYQLICGSCGKRQ